MPSILPRRRLLSGAGSFANLIANWDVSGGTTGFSNSGGVLSEVAGRIRLAMGAGTSFVLFGSGGFGQQFTMETSATYFFGCDLYGPANTLVRLGSTHLGQDYYNATTSSFPATFSTTFVATTPLLCIRLYSAAPEGTLMEADNFILRRMP
jgi:hypothetical protein